MTLLLVAVPSTKKAPSFLPTSPSLRLFLVAAVAFLSGLPSYHSSSGGVAAFIIIPRNDKANIINGGNKPLVLGVGGLVPNNGQQLQYSSTVSPLPTELRDFDGGENKDVGDIFGFSSLLEAVNSEHEPLLNETELLFFSSASSSVEWKRAAPLMFKRAGFAAGSLTYTVTVGGTNETVTKVFVAGGFGLIANRYGTFLTAAESLMFSASSPSPTWSSEICMNDARAALAGLLHPTTLQFYVFGGLMQVGPNVSFVNATASCARYEHETGLWTYVADMLEPRWYHNALTYSTSSSNPNDARFVVLGGTLSLNTSHFIATSSCEVYDPARDAWSSFPAFTHERMMFGSAIIAQTQVYIAGGLTRSSFSDQERSVEMFDGLKWSLVTHLPEGSVLNGPMVTLTLSSSSSSSSSEEEEEEESHQMLSLFTLPNITCYIPADDKWSSFPDMVLWPRVNFNAVSLLVS